MFNYYIWFIIMLLFILSCFISFVLAGETEEGGRDNRTVGGAQL